MTHKLPRIAVEDLRTGDQVKLSPRGDTWEVRETVGNKRQYLATANGGFRYLRKNMKLYLVASARKKENSNG